MWLIMGRAPPPPPLPLKFLPLLSPIFSRINDTWQVQNLKAPNKPLQNHLFSSLNHTFLFLSATLPWKTYCHVRRHSPAIWSWQYPLNLPLPFLHLKPLVSSTSPSISILSKFLSWHNLFLSISRLALSSFTFFFKNTISPFIYSTLTFFLTNPKVRKKKANKFSKKRSYTSINWLAIDGLLRRLQVAGELERFAVLAANMAVGFPWEDCWKKEKGVVERGEPDPLIILKSNMNCCFILF